MIYSQNQEFGSTDKEIILDLAKVFFKLDDDERSETF